MRIFNGLLVAASMFFAQSALADTPGDVPSGSQDNKYCATIASACTAAGFTRTDTGSKRFWQDCMKPALMGQTVSGVTVDAATVQACRTAKISELQNELNDLQKAMSTTK